jgi:hypothetical protein
MNYTSTGHQPFKLIFLVFDTLFSPLQDDSSLCRWRLSLTQCRNDPNFEYAYLHHEL